jgi:hypothetical protein
VNRSINQKCNCDNNTERRIVLNLNTYLSVNLISHLILHLSVESVFKIAIKRQVIEVVQTFL